MFEGIVGQGAVYFGIFFALVNKIVEETLTWLLVEEEAEYVTEVPFNEADDDVKRITAIVKENFRPISELRFRKVAKGFLKATEKKEFEKAGVIRRIALKAMFPVVGKVAVEQANLFESPLEALGILIEEFHLALGRFAKAQEKYPHGTLRAAAFFQDTLYKRCASLSTIYGEHQSAEERIAKFVDITETLGFSQSTPELAKKVWEAIKGTEISEKSYFSTYERCQNAASDWISGVLDSKLSLDFKVDEEKDTLGSILTSNTEEDNTTEVKEEEERFHLASVAIAAFEKEGISEEVKKVDASQVIPSLAETRRQKKSVRKAKEIAAAAYNVTYDVIDTMDKFLSPIFKLGAI